MDSSNLKKVKEFLGEKSRRRRQRAVVTALAGIVVLSTAYVLSKPAQTLVKDTYCGMEEHVHLEDCYGQGLICGYEDAEEAPGGLGQSDSSRRRAVPKRELRRKLDPKREALRGARREREIRQESCRKGITLRKAPPEREICPGMLPRALVRRGTTLRSRIPQGTARRKCPAL